MHRFCWLCGVFLLSLSALTRAAELPPSPDIQWMSEQYPPYNYTDEHGNPQGISVEVLDAIAESLGETKQQVEFLPWARAYARLQREPQAALFSMTYTPEREQRFRFVGPIISTRMVLLAPRTAGLRVSGAQDLAGLKVGVIRDDIGELMLRELGVGQEVISYSNRADNLIQQLHRGRVDAIAYSYDVAVWNMRKAGIDPQAYESVYTLLEGRLGYAFHAQTPDDQINRLQQALEQVTASGRTEQVRVKYLGAPSRQD